VRQEFVIRVEHLARHAVSAAEVAAVGNGNAQVAHRPAARVGQRRTVVARGGNRRAQGVFDGNDLVRHGVLSLKIIIAEGIVRRMEKPVKTLAVVMQRRNARSLWAEVMWEPVSVLESDE